MAFKFFEEEITPYIPSLKGPTISLSMRRGQVSFSKEASTLLKLKTGQTYLTIAYDDVEDLLGFKVYNTKQPGSALVQDLQVYATGTSVNVIYAFSIFEKIPTIPKDGSYKYSIKEGDGGIFQVDLKKGKKNPKAKSKVAK